MNVERWQRVKRLLDEAMAIDAALRDSFLDRECGVDLELRREVASLLSYNDQVDTSFLKRPAVDLQTVATPAALREGHRIGAYEVREPIGQGGMGEVYRAVRADGQYTKEVAIKLVRAGMFSPSALERFRTERQILASLDHPNIARLLDGGTTGDGIPYLVMELIEGVPIDMYCDERKLSVTWRLQLFRQVCAAVQYAHQRLVIHRDIKPGNILVTNGAVPKLLDFGIAKLLDASGGPETTLARPMTPEYASPEQVRGEPITTASDVYSLGVVLYQILTGRSPYPAETQSTHELGRAICETDPSKPSTVVGKPYTVRHGEQVEQLMPEQAGSVREGSAARLRRRLAGDLDNIVLMALRKEPRRRYASVEQLSEDIRRHLEGLPVTASPDSRSYRLKKFVQRHRAGVAAAVLVVAAIAGGVGATIREARIAEANAKRAEKRFNDVRELANSLVFEIHDSIQNLPGATPSRKLLLDRAVQYLDKLTQDAAGDVNLQRELAWGYQRLAAVQGDTTESNLGQIDAAAVSINKSIALFEAVAKANPHHLQDQLNLAMAYRRRAFTDIYEPTGMQEIQQALAVTEPLMRTDAGKVEVRNERALEIQILADVQDATGDRLQSIASFQRYLDLRREILRTNPEFKGADRGVAKALIMLGHQTGRFRGPEEALPLLNDGIAQFEALTRQSTNPDVARDLAASELRRAQVYLFGGNPAAALGDFRVARESTARLAKRDPQNQMLQSDMCGFDFEDGRALAVSGKLQEGLRLLKRSLQCYQDLKMEADTGPGAGAIESWIGESYLRLRQFPEAVKHYQNAAAALTPNVEKFDDARCDLAMVQTKAGNTLARLGKLPEAEGEYKKALQTANLSFSLERTDVPALYAAADANTGLGDLAAARAQNATPADRPRLLKEARTAYENSLNIWKQIPYPAAISGNGYPTAADPAAVTHRLARLPR